VRSKAFNLAHCIKAGLESQSQPMDDASVPSPSHSRAQIEEVDNGIAKGRLPKQDRRLVGLDSVLRTRRSATSIPCSADLNIHPGMARLFQYAKKVPLFQWITDNSHKLNFPWK